MPPNSSSSSEHPVIGLTSYQALVMPRDNANPIDKQVLSNNQLAFNSNGSSIHSNPSELLESNSYSNLDSIGTKWPNQGLSCYIKNWCISAFHTIVQQWKVLLLGQILAASITVGSSLNDVLVHKCSLGDAPAFQMMWMYIALGIVFGIGPRILHICLCRHHTRTETSTRSTDISNEFHNNLDEEGHSSGFEGSPIDDDDGLQGKVNNGSWKWKLFIAFVAFFDVEGNYLIVKAFQYTSFRSIAILDCLAIPTTMVTSYYLLDKKYTWQHVCGSTICILGACLTTFSDYNNNKEDPSNSDETHLSKNQTSFTPSAWRATFGDILAIIGAFIYGISDTLAELAVKHVGQVQYLSSIGFYGSIIALLQVVAFEQHHVPHYFGLSSSVEDQISENDDGGLIETCPVPVIWGILSVFVLINAISYVGVAKLLIIADATLFNLSMLSGDAWAVVLSVFIEKTIPTFLFYMSLVVLVIGVVIYENASAADPIQSVDQSAAVNNGASSSSNNFFHKYSIIESEIKGGHQQLTSSSRLDASSAKCARKEKNHREGKERAKEIAISRNVKSTLQSNNRSKRHGARNQRRHQTFVKWLMNTFPQTNNKRLLVSSAVDEQEQEDEDEGFISKSVAHVLDVAGGKGELAARLSICHKIKVVVVDPREANVEKCYDDCVFKTVPKKYQERLTQRRKDSPSYLKEEVNKYVSQLIMCFDEHAVETNPQLMDAVVNASVLVGMHADGATEAIVNVALKYKKPFVVVPCCVFPTLFPNRFIVKETTSDERPEVHNIQVRSHEQFCQYLLRKDPRFVIEELPFEGRNTAIWWDGK